MAALPGGFTTSPALAVHATLKQCAWQGGSFDSGTFRTTSDRRYQCQDGVWANQPS